MTQQEILDIILKNKKATTILDNLGKLHCLTKHYLLIAEELSEDGFTFLQPLKEHRDAYEHLTRIFGLSDRDDIENGFDIEKYIETNINKAFGHEYRAFFDTVDWLTYICRKYIRENLSSSSIRKRYKLQFENYDYVKSFINNLPFEIAEHREGKDIGENDNLLSKVSEYQQTLDNLLEIYKNVDFLLNE